MGLYYLICPLPLLAFVYGIHEATHGHGGLGAMADLAWLFISLVLSTVVTVIGLVLLSKVHDSRRLLGARVAVGIAALPLLLNGAIMAVNVARGWFPS